MDIRKAAVLAVCFIASSFGSDLNAQIEKADYLWIVDTSSKGHGRNIYIQGIQHAIDTFYTEVAKTDEIHAYSFGKSICDRDDIVDADFNRYSDMTVMMEGLDSLISHSKSRYVRAFILSDFFNDTPLSGDVPINPTELGYLQRRLMSTCSEKDVRIYLLVTPPTSNFGGYSLEQVRAVLPSYCTRSFSVTPDKRTVDYLIQAVDETNRQRGIGTDEVEEESTPVVTYVILCLFLAVIVGTILYFSVNRKKTVTDNTPTKHKRK